MKLLRCSWIWMVWLGIFAWVLLLPSPVKCADYPAEKRTPVEDTPLIIEINPHTAYTPTYTITPAAGPHGTISPTTPQVVLEHDNIVFTMIPELHYEVETVTVDGIPVFRPTNLYTFTNVVDNHTISATFILEQLRLSVRGEGAGVVTRNPSQAIYRYGDQVQLTAHPSTLGTFVGWSGAITGTQNPITITIQADTVITAHFSYSPTQLRLYVDRDATGTSHDGLSWSTAYTNVQEALDQANLHIGNNYEIWVAQGVYYPDEGGAHRANAVTETFQINWNNVQLYGGFVGTETLRTERDWVAHPTILSGDIDNNDVNTDSNYISEVYTDTVGANAYHVLYLNGTVWPITAATVIDGFIITAGKAMLDVNTSESEGAGLFCQGEVEGDACSPTLTDLIFSGNRALNSGGGIFSLVEGFGSINSPHLTRVTFQGNRAKTGGGMFLAAWGDYNEASPVLTQVTFHDNQALTWGGGLQISVGGSDSTSNAVLTYVTFDGNRVSTEGGRGGGMANEAGATSTNHAMLLHALFINNVAAEGGGFSNMGWTFGTSNPTLSDVLFDGNVGANYGGGMYNESQWGTASPILSNVVFSGNLSLIGYMFVEVPKGGGFYNKTGGASSESRPVLTNVVFKGNAAQSGGALGNENSDGTSNLTLINVLFSGNRAYKNGGAMYDAIYSTAANGRNYPTLINTTFSGNKADLEGGAIYHYSQETGVANQLMLVNSILWANTAITSSQIANFTATVVAQYSDIQGGYAGTGNLNLNPQFIAPIAATAAPTITGDYHVNWGSPVIDAGTNVSVTAATDIDGNDRIMGPVVDMGAYEIPARSLTVNRSAFGGLITSDPPGIVCGITCTYGFVPGSVVTLTYSAPFTGTFLGWGGAVTTTTTHIQLTMGTNQTVVANLNFRQVFLPLVLKLYTK